MLRGEEEEVGERDVDGVESSSLEEDVEEDDDEELIATSSSPLLLVLLSCSTDNTFGVGLTFFFFFPFPFDELVVADPTPKKGSTTAEDEEDERGGLLP
jgi:hypothetical protein